MLDKVNACLAYCPGREPEEESLSSGMSRELPYYLARKQGKESGRWGGFFKKVRRADYLCAFGFI